MCYAGVLKGPDETTMFSGFGCCCDSVTPYAFGIAHALDILLAQQEADTATIPMCVFPTNKAVSMYVRDYVPKWRRNGGVSGKQTIPEGRDEWYRVEENQSSGNIIIDTVNPKIFRSPLEHFLKAVRTSSSSWPKTGTGEFIRIPSHEHANDAA